MAADFEVGKLTVRLGGDVSKYKEALREAKQEAKSAEQDITASMKKVEDAVKETGSKGNEMTDLLKEIKAEASKTAEARIAAEEAASKAVEGGISSYRKLMDTLDGLIGTSIEARGALVGVALVGIKKVSETIYQNMPAIVEWNKQLGESAKLDEKILKRQQINMSRGISDTRFLTKEERIPALQAGLAGTQQDIADRNKQLEEMKKRLEEVEGPWFAFGKRMIDAGGHIRQTKDEMELLKKQIELSKESEEDYAEALRTAQMAEDYQNRMEGIQITESLRTATDEYSKSLERLTELLDGGNLTQDAFKQKSAELSYEFKKSVGALTEVQVATKEHEDRMESLDQALKKGILTQGEYERAATKSFAGVTKVGGGGNFLTDFITKSAEGAADFGIKKYTVIGNQWGIALKQGIKHALEKSKEQEKEALKAKRVDEQLTERGKRLAQQLIPKEAFEAQVKELNDLLAKKKISPQVFQAGLKDAQEKFNRASEDESTKENKRLAERLSEQFKTPLEKFQDSIGEIQMLWDKGFLKDPEVFNRAIKEAQDELDKAAKPRQAHIQLRVSVDSGSNEAIARMQEWQAFAEKKNTVVKQQVALKPLATPDLSSISTFQAPQLTAGGQSAVAARPGVPVEALKPTPIRAPMVFQAPQLTQGGQAAAALQQFKASLGGDKDPTAILNRIANLLEQGLSKTVQIEEANL